MRCAAGLALLAALIVPAGSNADRWTFPERAQVTSPRRDARFTIIPRRDFGVGELGPFGILERRLDETGYRVIWMTRLVNALTPVDAVVSDSGAFAITLDDYHAVGYGNHTIVVYDRAGQVRHELSLSDILPEQEIAALPRSVSSIWWRCDGALVDEAKRRLVLPVRPTGTGEKECRSIALDLVSGRAIRPDAPDPSREHAESEPSSAARMMSATSFKAPRGWEEKLEKQIASSPPIIRRIRRAFSSERPVTQTQAEVATEVERLLAAGADPNATDANGLSALHWATNGGMPEVALLLVQNGADPMANQDEWDGPFSTAIANDDGPLVRAMLAAGADPNHRFGWGDTALANAISFDAPEALEALLAAGADPNLRSKNRSPLEEALRHQQWRAKDALIRAGAQPRGLPAELALRWAVEENDVPAAAAALPRASEFDPEESVPESALARAAELGFREMVDLLVRSRIDPDSRSGLYGTTPLIEASKMDRAGVVEALLRLGADVNAGDAYGYTPLDVAVIFRSKESAGLLRDAGGTEGVGGSRIAELK